MPNLIMSKRYEAYILKRIKVKLASVNLYIILDEDLKIKVDPFTHLAYYGVYNVQLNKSDYSILV